LTTHLQLNTGSFEKRGWVAGLSLNEAKRSSERGGARKTMQARCPGSSLPKLPSFWAERSRSPESLYLHDLVLDVRPSQFLAAHARSTIVLRYLSQVQPQTLHLLDLKPKKYG
jgi:hypothetical protein